jgi:hypothetical protein
MSTIKNATDLDLKILALEHKLNEEWPMLKEELGNATENLNPLNLIKNAIHTSVDEPFLKSKLLANVVGLAVGYASKKLFFGKNKNLISKIAGTLLELEVANIVSSEPEKIQLILNIAKRMLKKNEII